MKFAKVALLSTILFCSASAVRAEHDWNWSWHDRFSYAREGDKFKANEFTIDLFGSYKRGQKNVSDFFDEPEHGVWGGGIGVNYFFTRFIGVGGDVSAHDDGRQFVDNASGNVIFRFPIEAASMAPYVFGGGGGTFDPTEQWEGHVGGGLEFRLNPHTGIFADARYIWNDKTADQSLIRTGLRFAF